MKKFLSDSKMFEFEKFYKECQKNNVPFIKAKKNPIDSNYLVQMDLGTAHGNLKNDSQNKIHVFFEKEKEFLKGEKLYSVFKGCNVNKEIVWFDGVLPKRLNYFCETLFDLVKMKP
ncbi:MAG: hypothetical protein H2B05_04485 [Nitrosopumilaceae archaeon]|jgi:hypothetical protein|uniref:Uncharacterized protein n=3 Tax=Candidatus Nitrosomaritimum aestuariumsis TaxID=3342354 RepID=A0AC60VXR4_9ARCH|nr:hypothetical protein [Nitrosopumilaceae archaeon]MBA4454183.1 hypothetical protein [Nitrosopumilaceae archaeon]MBA4459477.1 hypothetical protein [Nitrosopumilaceae archaeon]MBA4462481.1 hypothetical protein [Nitrosopumilaceae archaeon]MBA4463495.1 hypothetical protein [Nitrosopumilaceae archaeon]